MMNRIITLILTAFITAYSFGQHVSDAVIDTYINTYIVPNASNAITAAKMNQVLNYLCDSKLNKDSINNHQYWFLRLDTTRTLYNVRIDSSFLMKYGNWYTGYYKSGTGDLTGEDSFDSAIVDGYITPSLLGGDAALRRTGVKIGRYNITDMINDATGTSYRYHYGSEILDHVANGSDVSYLKITGDSITFRTDKVIIWPLPPQATKVGRMLHINQYGQVEWMTPKVLYDTMQRDVASSPTALSTWIRDNSKKSIFPATLTDYIGIRKNNPDAPLCIKAIDDSVRHAIISFYTGSNNYAGSISMDLKPNMAWGYHALDSNTTGTGNIAIGYLSASATTTGTNNISIGYDAIRFGNGISNIAIGTNSLSKNNSNTNVAIGVGSLQENIIGSCNTALGAAALQNSITADNTAVGSRALRETTTGYDNAVLGGGVMEMNVSGNGNIAMGMYAGHDNRSIHNTISIGNRAAYYQLGTDIVAEPNIAIGGQALIGDTLTSTGSGNVAIGYQSLYDLSTGDNNVLVGNLTGIKISTGGNNTGVGDRVLSNNLSGVRNTAIGSTALANTTGGDNTGIGANALLSNTSGGDNTALGSYAGYSNGIISGTTYIGAYSGMYQDNARYATRANTMIGAESGVGTSGASGSGNTAIGHKACNSIIDGDFNVAVGNNALDANTYGANNTAIGVDALGDCGTGSGNVALGYQAGGQETGSNKLYIDNSNTATPLIGGDFSTDAVTINGSLNVTGQITYDFKHLVIYTTGGSYTPNTVSNTEFRLLPGFSTTENDGFTFAGDSIVIITPGDYSLTLAVSMQGANGSDWIFKVRKNGAAITTGNMALSTSGAGNYISSSWPYYLPGLSAGDRICFTVTNEGASDDPTFRSIKCYLKKEQE